MVNVAQYNALKQQLSNDRVGLVAVTKLRSIAEIQVLYDLGHRVFGENRVQELLDKQQQLPQDIEWHFIGHLQRNKVKYIVPFVTVIHAIDSWELLQIVEREATKCGRTINCLLQVHIAQESSKFGMTDDELLRLWEQEDLSKFSAVRVAGLMGMATFTDNLEQIRSEFQHLSRLFTYLQQHNPRQIPLSVLSMGMSSDYSIAIEAGSTLVRVGSLLFE